MTDICKGMEEPTKMMGYADDWIIYISHKLPRVAEARFKKAADKVIKWSNVNGFRISAEKTKSMFIHRWNRVLGRTPRIRIWINNVEIVMTNHHRILGLIFDQPLNWEEHIKDVKARAMEKLNITIHPPQNSQNDHLTNIEIWSRRLRISIAHNTKNLRPCPPQISTGNFCSMPNRKRFT
jgi:hypothetical protein